MTISYIFRLLCLCAACLFLIHFLLGFITYLIAPVAIRSAERMKPRSAARVVLLLRLAPFGFAIFVVAALCVPSYLRLEPRSIPEPIGFGCLAAASLGAAICALSIARALGALRTSRRYVKECRDSGFETRLGEDFAPAFIVETTAPCFSLAGVFRPRLIISSQVPSILSTEQLESALRHERAHQISRDNLKRLLLVLAPAIFPFMGGFEALERAWAKFSEWAADDEATEGEPEWSVSLAEALVRLARVGTAPGRSQLVTSLSADGSDVASRVERLLSRASGDAEAKSKTSLVSGASAIVFAAAVVLLAQNASLSFVHVVLERLIH